VLFRDDWAMQHAEEKHPELKFLSAAPQLRAGAVVSAPS
jgi:peptide chain release factor 3